MTISEKNNLLNSLIDSLIVETIKDDEKLKDLDKAINPNSYSASVHLAKTIKELLNEKE
jgi:hypothetical protein